MRNSREACDTTSFVQQSQRHQWQQLEQILSPDYSPYSNPIRLFLPFQVSFLSCDFVLSLGEGWKHVSDQSEHTLPNFLTIRIDLVKKGEGNGRKKLTNKTPVNDGWGNTVFSPLFWSYVKKFHCSRFSLHPRRLQLGDTSGLRCCGKRQNWAVLFWGLLGFGLLRSFLHLLAPLGNRSVSCIQHSAIWDAIPKLTRHISVRILEFRKPQGWMSSVSLAPSPL